MKDVQIKCFEIGDNTSLYEAVRECLENEVYGLLKIKGVKVALDPYKYKLYGREESEAVCTNIEKIANQKLCAKYAEAVLKDYETTKRKIEEIFKHYGQYFPVKNMSKDTIIKADIHTGLVYDTLAAMYSMAKRRGKFILQEVNEQLVVSGPNIGHYETVETFNNDDVVQRLEFNLQQKMKKTDSR